MPTIQAVIDKATEVAKIALDYISQAAASLIGTAGEKAEILPVDEMYRRFDIASRTLRGEDGANPFAVGTTLKTPPGIAHAMVDSYEFDQSTGVSTFTVPAGVTDVEAMTALNEYFRKNHPTLNRDVAYVVLPDHLEWFESLPIKGRAYCEQRDYSEARQITITGVVKGMEGKDRETQRGVLKEKSLVFSDPRDQALAAAIHACKHNGEDLFQDLWVRGSVPGVVLDGGCGMGFRVRVRGRLGDGVLPGVAMSGSPSPDLK